LDNCLSAFSYKGIYKKKETLYKNQTMSNNNKSNALSMLHLIANKKSNSNNYYSSDDNSALKSRGSLSGFLVALFSVLISYLLVRFNNFWVTFSVALASVTYVVFDTFIIKKKKNSVIMSALVIVFILSATGIGLWQYFTQKGSSSENGCHCEGEPEKKYIEDGVCQNLEENFYTLFTPFQEENKEIQNIDTTVLSFRASKRYQSKMKKEPLEITSRQENKKEIFHLSKNLLAYSDMLFNVNIQWENNPRKLVDQLINHKTDLIAVPLPFLSKEKEFLSSHSLFFLGNLSQNYVFLIANVSSGINGLGDLKNKKIGVPDGMEFLDLVVIPEGNEKVTENNTANLFRLLSEGKIDLLVWYGNYPNDLIDMLVLSNIAFQFKLIPCHHPNEKAFLQYHPEYFPASLDLSQKHSPAQYLPSGVEFANHFLWMSNYSANYITVGFNIALLCRSTLNHQIGKEIAKMLFEKRYQKSRKVDLGMRTNNYDPINQIPYYHPQTSVELSNQPLSYVQYHPGAKEFYQEKGLLAECDDPRCLQYVGIQKCPFCKSNRKKEAYPEDEQEKRNIGEEKNIYADIVPFQKVWFGE
jgi:TRAP-type uncharacterized transport system substrate-binding protein